MYCFICFIYIAVGDPIIKTGSAWLPLSGSITAYFCSSLKPGHGCLSEYMQVVILHCSMMLTFYWYCRNYVPSRYIYNRRY